MLILCQLVVEGFSILWQVREELDMAMDKMLGLEKRKKIQIMCVWGGMIVPENRAVSLKTEQYHWALKPFQVGASAPTDYELIDLVGSGTA